MLSQRILDVHDDLTRSERRLADLLLRNPDALLLHSAAELSAEAKVSKATTTRFFQRLGYPSSRTAQKEAREGKGGWARGGVETGSIAPERLGVGAPTLSDHLAGEMQNLMRTIEGLRPDEVSRAVAMMAGADKLWVVGFGDNYPLAHLARSLLIRVRPDIRMIPIGGFSVPEEFASIRASDTLLALGVGRRARLLRSLMRSARRVEANVVFITDQAGSSGSADGPFGGAGEADVTLRARVRGTGPFESAVAPVSLLTYLCSALALRIGEAAIDRLEFIDRIHAEWGEGLDGDA